MIDKELLHTLKDVMVSVPSSSGKEVCVVGLEEGFWRHCVLLGVVVTLSYWEGFKVKTKFNPIISPQVLSTAVVTRG